MIWYCGFLIIVTVGTVLCNDVISQRRHAPGIDSKLKFLGRNRRSSALKSSSIDRDAESVNCRRDDSCRGTNIPPRKRDVRDDEEESEFWCPNWKKLEDDEYLVYSNNSLFVKIWNVTLSPERYRITNSSYYACDSRDYDKTFRSCKTYVLTFYQDEYIIMPNQSVFVSDWNMTFRQDEYLLIDSILYVCAPFSRDDPGDEADKDELSQDSYILANCSRPNGVGITELDQSEYVMLANASVFVLRWNMTFNPGEYKLVLSKLFVCSQFTPKDFGKTIATYIGLSISLISLLVLFVTYMVFSELRNTPGKCVICLASSLFVGQFSFCFIGFKGAFCFYLAAIVHYAFLASFAWTSVLAFVICRTLLSHFIVSDGGTKSRRFLYYSAIAWGLPLIIVVTCLCLDFFLLDSAFRPGYGDGDFCWISKRMSLIIFFIVPLGVSLVGNFVLFSVTVYRMCQSSRTSGKVLNQQHSKVEVLVCVKLSFIMGLTWVFAFLANFTQWIAMWYLFILFNTLQGAFLCFSFVCTKNVFRLLRPKTRGSLSGTRKQCFQMSPSTVPGSPSV